MKNKREIIKAATDKLCEIFCDAGHACSPNSSCWKQAECPAAEELEHALKIAMRD